MNLLFVLFVIFAVFGLPVLGRKAMEKLGGDSCECDNEKCGLFHSEK